MAKFDSKAFVDSLNKTLMDIAQIYAPPTPDQSLRREMFEYGKERDAANRDLRRELAQMGGKGLGSLMSYVDPRTGKVVYGTKGQALGQQKKETPPYQAGEKGLEAISQVLSGVSTKDVDYSDEIKEQFRRLLNVYMRKENLSEDAAAQEAYKSLMEKTNLEPTFFGFGTPDAELKPGAVDAFNKIIAAMEGRVTPGQGMAQQTPQQSPQTPMMQAPAKVATIKGKDVYKAGNMFGTVINGQFAPFGAEVQKQLQARLGGR